MKNLYYYKYDEFSRDLKKSVDKIQQTPDAIVAIARGGLTYGHFLAEAMSVRNLFSINAISYNDKEQMDTIEVFGTPQLHQFKRVLIVDDISDSGRTLKYIVDYLQTLYPEIEFETITIFYGENSEYQPTYYIHKSNQWIEFFWSGKTDELQNL